jgi:hypothetical protein
MITQRHVITLGLWALAANIIACSDEAQIIEGPGPSNAGGTPSTPTEEPPEPERPADTPPGDEPPAEADPEAPAPADTMAAEPIDEPADDPAADVAFTAPRGPCELGERVGGFSIEKQASFGVIQGAVTDGVVPTAIPRLVLEQGTCRVLERRNLACQPACVGAQTCGESGTCIPYPRQVSAGDVTISGLTRETVMSPQQPGNAYFAPGADNPPFTAQSNIVLSAAGAGELLPFQLFGVGSEPLAQAPAWVLEVGVDLALAWPAAATAVGTTVLFELTIDQHGISPLSLSCEFEDTGSASVPAAIVDQLIGAGVSGFPNGRITRRTADHVDLGVGCVELVVGSPLAASVSVAGETPCNGSGECPQGQTCNIPLQRCE